MSASIVLLLIVSFICRLISAALEPQPEPIPIPVYIIEPKKGKR